MHPKYDSDLQEEDAALIPLPLFAGYELRRELSPSAKETLLDSLDTIDEVDRFLDVFQQDIMSLRTREKATPGTRKLETMSEEGLHCPSSGSLDLQELIDNKVFYVEGDLGGIESGDSGERKQSGLESNSNNTPIHTDTSEILRPDVYVKPLVLRDLSVKRANDDGSFTAPIPNANTAKVLGPAAPKVRPLATSKRPVFAHRWNGVGLRSVFVPPRGGIDVGRSSASTFVDYSIHQELAQYQISSDRGPPKTPPVSPKTPHFRIPEQGNSGSTVER